LFSTIVVVLLLHSGWFVCLMPENDNFFARALVATQAANSPYLTSSHYNDRHSLISSHIQAAPTTRRL
jgi:hypothetical protein